VRKSGQRATTHFFRAKKQIFHQRIKRVYDVISTKLYWKVKIPTNKILFNKKLIVKNLLQKIYNEKKFTMKKIYSEKFIKKNFK